MENAWMIMQKIFLLILLIGAGCLAKRMKLLSDEGEKDLSNLLIDLFWPALAFVSIIKIDRAQLLASWSLPLLAGVTGFVGLLFGLLFVKLRGDEGDRRKIFLYHSTINNFVFMVLPFLNESQRALLFIHNIGFILVIWLVAVPILTGGGFLEGLKNLLKPALGATILAILVVLLGVGDKIPPLALNTLGVLGKPTVAVAMIIAGAQIYKLGRKALHFDSWNIMLGVNRLVVIPGALLGVTYLLSRYTSLPKEVLLVFMLVNVMPTSVNAVGIAMRFKSSPELAAQGVVFTHVFCTFTMLVYISVMSAIGISVKKAEKTHEVIEKKVDPAPGTAK